MDVLRFFDADMTDGHVATVASGTVGLFSARSPGKQSPNEDAAAVIPVNDHAAVLAIADGLGGERAGELASRLALERLIKSVGQAPSDEPSQRAAILNGIEEANQAVIELGLGAATTIIVAEVQGPTVRPYHVGDSMILVVGQRGKVKLQTISHSPVGYAMEAGLLDETEAMHHEERHLVSNILGSADMRIEVGPTITLAPRDTLLLASDGLFDNLHTREIIAHIRKGPLKSVTRSLADDCRRRMQGAEPEQPSKPDDLTFLTYRRRWS